MTLPRPQRIGHDSPPGSLLKRIGEAAPAPRKDETDNDPAYLALVRQCPCLKCGMDPCGVAAHLRANSGLHNKRQSMQRGAVPDRQFIEWIRASGISADLAAAPTQAFGHKSPDLDQSNLMFDGRN